MTCGAAAVPGDPVHQRPDVVVRPRRDEDRGALLGKQLRRGGGDPRRPGHEADEAREAVHVVARDGRDDPGPVGGRGVDDRPTDPDRDGTGLEIRRGRLAVDRRRSGSARPRQRSAQLADVARSDRRRREQLHERGAGPPRGVDLGRRERARDDRHAASEGRLDDLGSRIGLTPNSAPASNAAVEGVPDDRIVPAPTTASPCHAGREAPPDTRPSRRRGRRVERHLEDPRTPASASSTDERDQPLLSARPAEGRRSAAPAGSRRRPRSHAALALGSSTDATTRRQWERDRRVTQRSIAGPLFCCVSQATDGHAFNGRLFVRANRTTAKDTIRTFSRAPAGHLCRLGSQRPRPWPWRGHRVRRRAAVTTTQAAPCSRE